MNPFYEIFNRRYIQQQVMFQQPTPAEQAEEVQKSTQALKDFLESHDKILLPEYQQIATAEYFVILYNYFRKHNVQL